LSNAFLDALDRLSSEIEPCPAFLPPPPPSSPYPFPSNAFLSLPSISAVENYVQAADYFSSENSKSSANDALQKTAFLLTTSRGSADPSVENYARAAKIFEEVATWEGGREKGREGGREGARQTFDDGRIAKMDSAASFR